MNSASGIMSKNELQILKKEYLNRIFPSTTIFLFLFLIIFIYSSFNNSFGLAFLLLTFFAVAVGTSYFYLITQKIRLDLKFRKVNLLTEIIEDKVYKLDYEPGSASLPVNLLSLLFLKKISKLKMKEMHIYYIVVQGEKIYVDKKDFEKAEIGKPIIFRRTENTQLFLGLEAL
jgi:hypothetical protein